MFGGNVLVVVVVFEEEREAPVVHCTSSGALVSRT